MNELITSGVNCLRDEAAALLALADRLDERFAEATRLILACKGKLIITGVGKSGHVGSKIAATLASTGTPSFFLNALDAYHGDLGMISDGDVVMALSYSGSTEELMRLVPLLVERGIPVIGMSGHDDSLLARYATVHLNVAIDHEADPLNLAPTTSTTVMMALGDALACALMRERHFQPSDFARFHPGGDLGKRLVTTVSQMMVSDHLPLLSPETTMAEALEVVTNGKLGIGIVLQGEQLVGVLTDGDVRRAMQKYASAFAQTQVQEVMSRQPKTIQQTARIVDAGEEMNHYSIHSLIVLDGSRVVGVIDSFSCLPGTRFYH